MQGDFILYFQNGNFKEKKNYENGTLQGDFYNYYENGNI